MIRYTAKQNRLIKNYEKTTGFEFMHKGEMEFTEAWKRNMRWFRDWAEETAQHLEKEANNVVHKM